MNAQRPVARYGTKPFSRRMTLREIWAALEKKYASGTPKEPNGMIRRLPAAA